MCSKNVGRLVFAGGNELSLTFLQTFMDRGYWMWSALKLLVVAGAHVYGTVKRCNWFPFTYGQILKPKDNRILIEQNGIRKLEKKVVSIDKRSQAKVIATAYRNANGGVILGIESNNVDSAFEYDISFANDSDYRKWAAKNYAGLKKLLLSQISPTMKKFHQHHC